MGRFYEEIQKQGAEVLVIGPGSRKAAERTARTLKLPFPVLADPDRAVYRQYDLDKVFMIQRSGTFLVDRQGSVRYIEQGILPQMLNEGELLREIKKLQNPSA